MKALNQNEFDMQCEICSHITLDFKIPIPSDMVRDSVRARFRQISCDFGNDLVIIDPEEIQEGLEFRWHPIDT